MADKKLTIEEFDRRVKAAMQGATPSTPGRQSLGEILKQLPPLGQKQLAQGK